MSKGGGGGTNTVQQADPWVGVQPALHSLYDNAQSYYNSGGPQYYPGQTVAGQAPQSNAALALGTQRAMNGSPVMQSADLSNQLMTNGTLASMNPASGALGNFANGNYLNNPANQYLSDTANGKYLSDQNPYLSGMVQNATNQLAQQYQNVVAPSIASQFSAAGRFGSGQQQDALAQGAQPLAQALAGATSSIYGNAYNNERGLQNQAATTLGNNYNTGRQLQLSGAQQEGNNFLQSLGLMNQANGQAPALANQDYTDLNALMGMGQYSQGAQQQLIDAAMQKYQFGQNQPLLNLQALQGLLTGGLQSGSQSSSKTNTPSNPFTNVLGSALAGNSLYQSGALGSVGSLFGGTAAGTALGTIAGGTAAEGAGFELAPLFAAAL